MSRFIPLVACLLFASPVGAADLVLPQNRNAFYFADEIELAVAALKKGAEITLEFVPQTKGLSKLSFQLTGDGSTLLGVLPPNTLAPGGYTLRLGDKEVQKITVSSDVRPSPMLLSRMLDNPQAAGGNFRLG